MTSSAFGPANGITTLGATVADDDLVASACGLAQGFATVWYKYTPDADSALSLDTFGADYDTFIAVWTGPDKDNLSLVACNNKTADTEALAIQVEKNTTYYIEVGQP